MKVKNISEHVQCLLCTSLKGENPPPAFLSLALGSLGELFQLKKNPGKMAGYLLRVSPDGVYWERAEDERVPDSPFQQQHHLLIPIAMVAELQTRSLEIQFSGGLNICFWHSQKCTSISMLIDPLEPRDHLFLHLYCLGRTARKT